MVGIFAIGWTVNNVKIVFVKIQLPGTDSAHAHSAHDLCQISSVGAAEHMSNYYG